MTDANAESDYTPYTILTILVVTALIVFYAYSIDLISHLDDSASSFQSSSSLVLLWRISCLFVGLCAIVYMLKCGPGNMRVMSLRDSEELILHPDGLSKFVTFSSWTLLSNVAYFLFSIIYHVLEKYEFSTPNLLLQLQIITFCTGIAMAFMTATIVRHIILPDEVRIGRNHDHMFLFHEQIMHNFAAIFLAVELILLQPELKPEFAIIGLFIGICICCIFILICILWRRLHCLQFPSSETKNCANIGIRFSRDDFPILHGTMVCFNTRECSCNTNPDSLDICYCSV